MDARRIWKRLGADEDSYVVEKPKHMHWRTFQRLMDEAEQLEAERWAYATVRFSLPLP